MCYLPLRFLHKIASLDSMAFGICGKFIQTSKIGARAQMGLSALTPISEVFGKWTDCGEYTL
jgi:hypothetical protein